LTYELVEAAFLLILGRRAEKSEIDFHLQHCDSVAALRDGFFASTEFLNGPQGSRRIRANDAYRIAYGSTPPKAEQERLASLEALSDTMPEASVLRAVLLSHDRQSHPSSITVRFTEADLELATHHNPPFKLFVDRFDTSTSVNSHTGQHYEDHLTGFYKKVIKPGMKVVDVGANIGFHTMTFGSLVGTSGAVFAFEPNTENCRLILLSAQQNPVQNINLFPFALSDHEGHIYFSPAIGSNGGVISNKPEALLNPNCIVLSCARLDQVLTEETVDFIKIDIEGGEYLALKGAEQLIRRHRPVIASELSLDMLSRVSGASGPHYVQWLMGLGYRPFTLGLSGPRTEIIDVDAFFESWGSYFRIEDIAFLPEEYDASSLGMLD
jgi:FkbM family methyltransferase